MSMALPCSAPRPTFSRRESRQRYARNLLVLDFEGVLTSGTRGRTPLDSPAFCPSGIGRGNLNPQASSGASHPPSHGLKAESVPSMKPEEKTRPICPLSSKWQIGLGLWQKVARRETERSAASAKRAAATHRGIPKGGSPWRAFGDFPRDGKVTRVQGGAPASGCWGYQPRINSGVRGYQPRSFLLRTSIYSTVRKNENPKRKGRF